MTSAKETLLNASSAKREQIERAWGQLSGLLGIEIGSEEMVRLVEQAETVRQNKQTLLRFQKEVFNGHDWSIETLSKHLTPDFMDHAAMPGDPPGFEGVQLRFSAWAAAFNDSEEENIAMLGEGDMLAVLYDLHAHHEGEFLGVKPTNREVVIPGIEFLRLRDGKIAEHWGIYDFLSTAEELGVDLAFLPRDRPSEPRHPEIPWRRELRPEDASAAEAYLLGSRAPESDGDADSEAGR